MSRSSRHRRKNHRLDQEDRRPRRHSARRSLAFESLERRELLAITVTTVQDVVDAGDGVTSLREAIIAANGTPASDTIDFAAALTAAGPATILLTQGEMAITAPLVIDGPGADKLTIDAQLQSRIFNITAATGAFTIDGLTLTHGRTSGTNSPGGNTFNGGAIRSLTTGTLTISNSLVTDNSTGGNSAGGGGLFAVGNVILQHSAVSGNRTDGNTAPGGGVYGLGDVSLLQSSVSGNSTSATSLSVGGVAAAHALFLLESVVANNVGGGLSATTGGIAITQSTVSGNSLVGVFAQTQSVTAVDSTIALNNGGIAAAGNVTLVRSTVSRNLATSAMVHAGGAYSSGGTVSLNQSIVAGNTAVAGSPDVDANANLVAAVRSIVGDKTGTNLVEAPVGMPDVNGSLIGGPVHGVIDAKLGPLQYFGGLVFLDGGRMLSRVPLPGSPAINAGDPGAVQGIGGVPTSDQRGAPWSRVVGGRIDIGAIEFQANPLPGDYNFDGTVNAADYTVWRDTTGSTTDLRADGTGPTPGVPDGVVNALDYAFWKTNFGHHLGAGGGGVAVAELALTSTAVTAPSDVTAIAGELPLAGVAESQRHESSGTAREGAGRRGVARRLWVERAGHDDALVAWLAAGRSERARHGGDDRTSVPDAADAAADRCERPALERAFALLGAG